ncbi:MAG: glycosyltransferase [Candidatus Pacebacteria bacterium]|nr:glycosyltransferase [Candidatus Paceibacterota bacterium]
MLNHNPKISVVMASHNGEEFIKQAIDSVLSQSFADFEFLIVDDGSTDLTGIILNEYKERDQRVKIITNPQCLGLTKSLNIAIGQAQGEFIARMDDDDISMPKRFAVQSELLDKNPQVVLCGTLGFIINEKGETIAEKNLAISYSEIKNRLLFNNQFIHSSLMIRKSILDQEGYYNEKFKKAQDYELVLRLGRKCQIVNLPERLIKWRKIPTSISHKNKEQKKFAIKARWLAITKYGYPKIQGLLHIIIRVVQMYA